MRQLGAMGVLFLLVACGGPASSGTTNVQAAQSSQAAVQGQGVASHSNQPMRNFVYNDYAMAGDTTLFAVISSDPEFHKGTWCQDGTQQPPSDDWLYLRVQDVYPRSGKENYRLFGVVFTRVYQVTFPEVLNRPFVCALLTGSSGTLLAEGTSSFMLTEENLCAVDRGRDVMLIRGGGKLETLPAFPCQSGTAMFDYAYHYMLSRDAVVDASCSLVSGEMLYARIDGPNLACIGK